MGVYFAVSSVSSWFEFTTDCELGEWAAWLVPALFSSAIASALLVSGPSPTC